MAGQKVGLSIFTCVITGSAICNIRTGNEYNILSCRNDSEIDYRVNSFCPVQLGAERDLRFTYCAGEIGSLLHAPGYSNLRLRFC